MVAGWLWATVGEARLLPTQAFTAPVLLGCVVAVTGLPRTVREVIESLVRKNGGVYTADLRRGNTHLLSEAAVGRKVEVARARWPHIEVVRPKWLYSTLVQGAIACERRHRTA